MADYVALTQTSFEKVSSLFALPEEAWEYMSEYNGCAFWRLNSDAEVTESGIYCVKTAAAFSSPAETVFNFIWDLKNRKKFDEYVKDVKQIEVLSGLSEPIRYSEILHQSFSMPFPLSNRDFVTIRAYKFEDNSWTTTARSVVHPAVPEDANFVRGDIVVDGFQVSPSPENPNHSYVRYVAQVDPKGSIPAFAVNLANRKVPQVLATLRDVISRENPSN
eukprot:CAMPEP_0184332340 /NCGR_PEP_ID=MMETSP1089-20130417/1521_1 /TAXON_ID=38269 ORGANISM="Gloeochaete wittrockiana, Strain SAG46.84" /NCGR_SAMPLE_ID=MMETSP1089 /ASSEMBLY_ACC=CAM_ASM_000445 /LENGTH=218 /DNA_ID=CAMNT_0026655661 /DNA_START=48 /DNA_END=704 /DNA_ORIENTATION=+